ncbi:hypothetical protein [Alkalimonas mucilaginosa]|uniref:DUF945 domain-containing protein n=1 Tax=Alkalimonas mucilaginosa TaxID=3057676 RepID=A0ABU7JEX4_9GAMM|nr:hypothetical protein [Alkalimonas sp. MEB004]MEE2024238.1 hypothetical protein [Alkalimonas sp. MEB004]
MKKKLIIPVVAVGLLVVGVQLANRQAAKTIEAQIAEINLSYAEMSQQGVLPALQLQYQEVRASVLRSRYQIEGLSVELQGLGQLFSIEQVQLRGIKPNRLADQGSVSLRSLALGSGARLFVPTELAAFSDSIKLHGDYSYSYQPSTGELELMQQTRINEEFSFSYQLRLSEMQAIWQQLTDISAMNNEQQQRLLESDSYIEQFTAAMLQSAIVAGELRLENDGFLQRLLTLTAGQGQTPDFSIVQGIALMALATAETVPMEIRQSLIAFVQEPRSLTLRFQLQQPLRFTELEAETASFAIDTVDELLEFAGVRLTVND